MPVVALVEASPPVPTPENAVPTAIQRHGRAGKRHCDVSDSHTALLIDEDTVPQAKINRLACTVSLRNGSIKVREALIDLRSLID